MISAADLESTAIEIFQEEHGAEQKAVVSLAQTVADKQALQPMELPPVIAPPSGASPQMQAYLIASAELTREQVIVHNQNCSGTIEQLEDALQQWQEQNASRIKQVSLMSKAVAQTVEN